MSTNKKTTTNKSSHQKCSFAAQSLCPANPTEPRLQLFARLRSRNPYTSAKLAMPMQPHQPALFCPLSLEAYLLTGKGIESRYQNQESRQRQLSS